MRRSGRQFLVFVTVGIFSAFVDILVMQVLVLAGIHYSLAVTVGFCSGLLVNYLSHAKVTFKTREANSPKTLIKFSVVVGLNYLITLLLVYLSNEYVGSVLMGKFASLPVIAVNGFLLSKYWVFK